MRFRLLNSEIGNDQGGRWESNPRVPGFRLLNSEIGNDQVNIMYKELNKLMFSSP